MAGFNVLIEGMWYLVSSLHEILVVLVESGWPLSNNWFESKKNLNFHGEQLQKKVVVASHRLHLTIEVLRN